jgi:16S rRNA (guanine527-N7)-methyltransferase
LTGKASPASAALGLGAQRDQTATADPEVAAVASLAAESGLAVSTRQATVLRDHLRLLSHWNATYNLTAVREPAAMRTQHLADCLAAVGPVARWVDDRPAGAPAMRALDVGSGGGLPGVVLAVMLPALQVHCIDAVAKKAAFVRQVAASLALPNLHAVHGRVEALPRGTAPFDLIVCRAFATLADFTRLSAPVLACGGAWLAMKGRLPDDEIAALPPSIEVFHVEPLRVPGLDAERCLVWMRPR